jgi:phosphatidate phosphatase LPIN
MPGTLDELQFGTDEDDESPFAGDGEEDEEEGVEGDVDDDGDDGDDGDDDDDVGNEAFDEDLLAAEDMKKVPFL